MPRVPKGSGLTIKERGFIQDLVKTKVIRKAVKKNYEVSSDRNASLVGNVLMNKPRIQYAILDLMDKMGVSDERLVNKLKEHIFESKKEVLDQDGKVIELKDNQTAIKALDMAMKIKGAYAPERHEISSVNLNIYQEMTDEELDRRIKFVEAREAIIAPGKGA